MCSVRASTGPTQSNGGRMTHASTCAAGCIIACLPKMSWLSTCSGLHTVLVFCCSASLRKRLQRVMTLVNCAALTSHVDLAPKHFEIEDVALSNKEAKHIPECFTLRLHCAVDALMGCITSGASLSVAVQSDSGMLSGFACVPLSHLLSETWVQGLAKVWSAGALVIRDSR